MISRLLAIALAVALLVSPATAAVSPSGGSPSTLLAPSNVVAVMFSTPSNLVSVNCNASVAAFLQFFDAAVTAGIVLGTTAPKYVLPLPSGFSSFLVNANFYRGIVVAATATATGSGSPSSTINCGVVRQ